MSTTVRLQHEPFDTAAEAAKLTRGRSDIGAVVTFTGICRADENGEKISALTLEHYPDMAEAEIARHVEEANKRWPLLGVTVILKTRAPFWKQVEKPSGKTWVEAKAIDDAAAERWK
jgi:molybdopterin synthase catalytic subunit